mmetsp:Transcript_31745/g.59062  ORF Transcript_31745/g.59062 Transcript_31745/m.59062 type:complete len:161 (+) Transcript_31745:107-589(+)
MMFVRRLSVAPSISRISSLSARGFSTTEGMLPTRYTHYIGEEDLAAPATIAPVMSLENMNSKEALATKKKEMINQFQMHHADTGSSQVQIAILTEKIISLTKHFAVHKKDKSGYRGYIATIQKRKRLMLHLKRHDPEAYKNVVVEKNLFKEAEQLAKYKK